MPDYIPQRVSEKERGKAVYIAFCRQNEKGENGRS
jgi:hypothetical protein